MAEEIRGFNQSPSQLERSHAHAIIESEHQAVFGESVSERLKRKNQLKQLRESDPDAYFNIPTIDRL